MDYWISVDDQRHGPYSAEQLFAMLRSGQVPANAMVYDPGKDPHWVPASTLLTAPLSPGREPTKTNGAAIASLILGILGLLLAVLIVGLPLALIAVILGFIALSSIGKSQQTATPQSGKGMAVAGLVTGGLGLVMGAVLVVAIAIPTYLNERNEALNGRNEALSAAVQTDLRNAAVAQETYFTTNQTYTVNLDNLQSLGFVPSPGVTIRIVTAGPSSYCMEGSASESATFRYDSSSGLAEGTC